MQECEKIEDRHARTGNKSNTFCALAKSFGAREDLCKNFSLTSYLLLLGGGSVTACTPGLEPGRRGSTPRHQ